MTAAAPVTRHHGNSYEIFILVVTLLSLAVMALLLLPLDKATIDALQFWDNLICVIFLFDFAYNITGSHPRRQYFIHQRGWLDLLGSIPSLGVLRFTALLRLARLSRLARIARLLTGQRKKELIADLLLNRGQYALFLTILLALVVMSVSSVAILQFESGSPSANITTGGDALWWSLVTITTVGYGDFYPVTLLGRIVATFVMFSGVGIIGALASILASLLLSPAPPTDQETKEAEAAEAQDVGFRAELAETREELARTREALDKAGKDIGDIKRLLEGRT
jgi:voltage-gated potassium channel